MVGVLKDSKVEWIGQVPNAWQEYRLENLVDNHFSGAWGNDEKGNELDRICMRIADFDYQKLQFQVKNVEDYTKRNYTKIEISKKTLKKGDILIEKSGGGEKTPVGRAVVYNLDNNALFANFMDCIRINDLSTPDFVKYYLFCSYCRGVTNLYFNQTTGIQNLNISRYLKESKVFLPDIDMQNDISSFLDEKCAEIDKLSEDIQKQIDILNDYKKSVITRAVTKGLDPNAEMKDSGIKWIGEIPKDWTCKKIKYLANTKQSNSFVDGDWIEAPFVKDNGIRYITTGNIGDGVFKRQGDGYVTEEDFKMLKCKYAYSGDLIFSRLNEEYGRSCILPNDYPKYVIAVDNVILRTEHDKRFICYCTQCPGYHDSVADYARGTAMKRISRINLGNISIPIPTLSEEVEIADYLDDKCSKINDSISAKQEQIAKLDTYKKSIIYEYVTGKKRVV